MTSAAVASYVLSHTVGGTITSGQFQVFGWAGDGLSTGTLTSGAASTGTCAVSLDDPGDGSGAAFSVSWTGGPIAGDTCVTTLGFQGSLNNAQDAVVTGAQLSANIPIGEVTVGLGADCGLSIAPGAQTQVKATFTLTSAATPGAQYALSGTVITMEPAAIADSSNCV
jgi:hypothetical protein